VALLQPINSEERRPSLRTALRLLGGIDWVWLDYEPKLSDEALLAVWNQHKDALIALCQEYNPDSYPCAYKRFEKGSVPRRARAKDERSSGRILTADDVQTWIDSL
jgi:hypothetical protein